MLLSVWLKFLNSFNCLTLVYIQSVMLLLKPKFISVSCATFFFKFSLINIYFIFVISAFFQLRF